MTGTVERFSDRVENYVKYRPGYPPAMLQFFKERLGLTTDSVIADIGSGTGISSKPFLENGNVVYGVEPNAAMRAAAESYLNVFNNFRSISGTSENTGMPERSFDLVIAAQAFHWFEPESTRRELKRIAKPDAYVCLIWNERQLDSTPFLRDYEALLLKCANDYERVRHENIDETVLASFFEQDFQRATFANHQKLDFDGLKGRILSSSYMPNVGDPKFEPMENELKALFAKHAQGGKITILYDTNLFYTQF
ncbi:MAG: class I SAM-dependent methyltransferase [Acidobacteria bacterium]|nr:MAG: class I SAM-dependent methyltransferase [Acidobacteriota bacterium]